MKMNKMKVLPLVLAMMSPLALAANVVTLSWSPPTARVDGTPIQPTDISAYHIYSDISPNPIPLAGNVYSYSWQEVETGNHCFTITATDLNGLSSAKSNQVCKEIIAAAPGVPTTITITVTVN